MKILVLDTETTGLIRDYTSPDAPHLASIAACIYDTDARRVQASLNLMVRPDGWEMPAEAEAVNGLSTDHLVQYGIRLSTVMEAFTAFTGPAQLVVGHNVVFDCKVVASALYRLDHLDELDEWMKLDTYCTMTKAKRIVNAKTATGRLKNPKLTEAYEFIFERPLERAHSANADMIATLELYLALQQYDTDVSL
jgi:DNA polymerase-3 subunit epsilon